MSQTNEEKLRNLQKRLDGLGIRDIKIHFDVSAKQLTRDQLCEQVVNVLSSYLDSEKTPLPPFFDADNKIDAALDSVLRASGSALRHYIMQSTLDDMRKAMRKVMSDSYIAGSNDAMNVMRGNEQDHSQR